MPAHKKLYRALESAVSRELTRAKEAYDAYENYVWYWTLDAEACAEEGRPPSERLYGLDEFLEDHDLFLHQPAAGIAPVVAAWDEPMLPGMS